MIISLKPHTPFSLINPSQMPNHKGQCQVTLSAKIPALVLHLSTWQTEHQAFAQALANIVSLPSSVGHCMPIKVGNEEIAMCMRISSVEFNVLAKTSHSDLSSLKDQIIQAIPRNLGNSLDLSHARCYIEISGVKTCATLSKLFALDFRENAFPIRQAKLSGTHHAPVTLHRSALDSFDLWLHTSFAESLHEVVMDAALEFGVQHV